MKEIFGRIADIDKRRFIKGKIVIENGHITDIVETDTPVEDYILPGFIDSHVHIESSMLTPSAFSRLAAPHGTIACVCDPHEIANVNGIDGVEYMITDSKNQPLKLYFTVPSCVPATPFETSGAILDPDHVNKLLRRPEIVGLGEMMNFPGVINGTPGVTKKIRHARSLNIPIDGHAPGLTGDSLKKYVEAGITTDHESSDINEAMEKLQLGMKILIREGSAAKNYDALHPLLKEHSDNCMFCTDDSHPDDLLDHHIDFHVRNSVILGYDIFDILTVANRNPIEHYNLNVGSLRIGDPADFIIVDTPQSLNILSSWINGECIYDNQRLLFPVIDSPVINNFQLHDHLEPGDFSILAKSNKAKIIEATDGSLLTTQFSSEINQKNGFVQSDTDKDILFISVVNRYDSRPKPQTALIHGFGLKSGAIASTIAHDSHNIIAVGTDPESISISISKLIDQKGGICFYDTQSTFCLPLPVGGLMTNKEGEFISRAYQSLNNEVSKNGCNMRAPFMTLSFMALLVIPELKLGDKGLFDVNNFKFTELFV